MKSDIVKRKYHHLVRDVPHLVLNERMVIHPSIIEFCDIQNMMLFNCSTDHNVRFDGNNTPLLSLYATDDDIYKNIDFSGLHCSTQTPLSKKMVLSGVSTDVSLKGVPSFQ